MASGRQKLQAEQWYQVLVGINYGDPEVRREPGDVANDIPADDVPWLTEQGCIKPMERRERERERETPQQPEGGE